MPCIGKDALVVSDTGRVMELNPFTSNYDDMEVKLVDGTLKYDPLYVKKTYILLVRSALHVLFMEHSLVPPFVLREVGIRVKDTNKIHKVNPTVDDHAITFPETGLRIPLDYGKYFYTFPHLNHQ
eukprot:5322565-Ditylum_brightwellii.AAC.1